MIVIGDVHGCYETLRALLRQLPQNRKVIFAGDLIDRGPKSRQVVQFIKRGCEEGVFDCVTGNHEDMMIQDTDIPETKGGTFRIDYSGIWVGNGGLQAIESYKTIKVIDDVSASYTVNTKLIKQHAEWFKALPLYLEYPNVKNEDGRHLVVSHASVCKIWNNKDHRQFRETIMWNRTEPVTDVPGIYNIFGHTPHQDPIITKHYANIDTGAFKKDGVLTALSFPEMEVFQQRFIG